MMVTMVIVIMMVMVTIVLVIVIATIVCHGCVATAGKWRWLDVPGLAPLPDKEAYVTKL